MQKDYTLEKFAGPLDLLLQLIEEKEMEITEVSISDVTEQFLEYMEEVEQLHPEELADFLVVATRLLLLKSHALMPYLMLEEDEDPGELAAQLKMYKRYVEAMEGIEKMIDQKRFLYGRKPVRVEQEVRFVPPEGVDADQMRIFFVDVLERLEPVVRIPKTAVQRVVSLREKLAQVQKMIEKGVKLHFKELMSESGDREEVVVTFLALLELVKQRTITIQQDAHFADMTIERHE